MKNAAILAYIAAASGDAIYKMMAAKTGDGDKNRAKNTYLCFSYDVKREIKKNIIPSGY